MQEFVNNLIPILFLLFPVVLGAIVYFLQIKQAVTWVDSINVWLLRKKEQIAGEDGFVKKWFFRPMLWGLSKIMELTVQVENQYMRTGVRIAAYLYFAGILLYISIAIVVSIVILFIVLWFIFEVLLGGDDSSASRRSGRERVASKSFYDTRGIFSKKVREVDEDGNIYDTTGIFKKQVGKIDDDGTVYDSRGILNKQTGKIDDVGNIYDTTGIIGKQVGKIDEDGNVDDTTGVFNKNIGKLKKD